MDYLVTQSQVEKQTNNILTVKPDGSSSSVPQSPTKTIKMSQNVASVTSSFITVRKCTVAFLLFEKHLLFWAGPGAESHRQDGQRVLQWSRLSPPERSRV